MSYDSTSGCYNTSKSNRRHPISSCGWRAIKFVSPNSKTFYNGCSLTLRTLMTILVECWAPASRILYWIDWSEMTGIVGMIGDHRCGSDECFHSFRCCVYWLTLDKCRTPRKVLFWFATRLCETCEAWLGHGRYHYLICYLRGLGDNWAYCRAFHWDSTRTSGKRTQDAYLTRVLYPYSLFVIRSYGVAWSDRWQCITSRWSVGPPPTRGSAFWQFLPDEGFKSRI